MKKFSIIVSLVLGAMMAPAFTLVGAHFAQADYGYSGNYSNYNMGYIGNRYGYNRPSVTYVPQTIPVYITQPVVYQQPVYQPIYQQQVYQQPIVYNTQYFPNLTVSCSANVTYVGSGSQVTWSAYPSGGNGYYTYSWSGADGLYGSAQSINFSYPYAGQKTASVTVYSSGQTITQNCANSVTVVNSNYYGGNTSYYNNQYITQTAQPIYIASNRNGLDIGCFADPTSATINQPVSWSAEATGGMAPYTYSWTGSDGLSGSGSSLVKYYETTGTKSAVVSVTSADGLSSSHACSNTVTVSAHRATNTSDNSNRNSRPSQNAPANSVNTASAVFSVSSISWGWVAILVILVLFFTIVYLIFNRQKI